FCNFYFVKNLQIYNNSAADEVGEKITRDLESLKIFEHFGAHFTQLRDHQILHYIISQIFLVTAQLYTGLNNPIVF
ncbi:MAG: hypothetical protein ACK56I_17685, partial [bacterium]